MLQALALQPGDDVLEIGTGSGFATACLGALAREVVSLEIDPALADAGRRNLALARADANVRVEVADALAWQSERRFDAICVTGAVDVVPDSLVALLRPGGRLFVVRGRQPAMEAVLVTAGVNGTAVESLFETDLDYLRGASPVPRFHF